MEEKKTKKKRNVPDVSYPRCCLQTARGGDVEFGARGKWEEKKTKKKRTVPDVSYPRCCLQTARGGDAEFDARGKWLVLEEWTETVHLP